jgi:hypothetical protein
LAFENGVLAFENGVLAFEKVVLAFENGDLTNGEANRQTGKQTDRPRWTKSNVFYLKQYSLHKLEN